jgi:hypothetical protein
MEAYSTSSRIRGPTKGLNDSIVMRSTALPKRSSRKKDRCIKQPSKGRSVERKLKTEKKGAEKSILSPIQQKMMSDAIVVSEYCQIAPEATVAE